MIDFDEELKKFKLAPEVDMAEQVIRENAMTDLWDIVNNAARAHQSTEQKPEKQE